MKVTNYIKKVSLTAVLGLSALLCASTSLAANSFEDPQDKGVRLRFVSCIDATRADPSKFPMSFVISTLSTNCMDYFPAPVTIRVASADIHCSAPQIIENNDRWECSIVTVPKRFDMEIRNGANASSASIGIKGSGKDWKMWFRNRPQNVFLSKSLCQMSDSCRNTGEIPVSDHDHIYFVTEINRSNS